VDAVSALRVRHRRRVNAPLRGLITNILEDDEEIATNEEADEGADEDKANESGVSEDKKPKDNNDKGKGKVGRPNLAPSL
jgi:hypothetical protein